MAIRATVNADAVQLLAATLKGLTVRDILQEARTPVFARMNTAKNAIRNNLSGTILNRRTGALAASIETEGPEVAGSALLGRIGVLRGPATAYADIHLTGGTIRPKTAKKLAVPLPAALTPSGVARYASPLRQTLASAFPDGTFVAKDILFGKIGNQEIIPLFVLKDEVRIPKRDYMSGPMRALVDQVAGVVSNVAARLIFDTSKRR